jgi:Flp pilus assembly protein TadG
MKAQKTAPNQDAKRASLFQRIRVNKAGNTIAMTAAAIFPLAGMVGGAVDMSRMYAVKSRLQSACDAGALTGRRIMGGNTWASNGNAAGTQATNTFNLNFNAGQFGSESVSSSFTETGGAVSGTASARVPMTLMRIFNKPTETITVNCSSEMRIPNTDVMFVLDTTGSMASAIPGDPSGQSKIDGLKDAVKCFYQVLSKRDAGASATTCGSAPVNTGIGNAVQLRFGFVPYSTNVNVGKLLPTSFFADSWNYQSRVVQAVTEWRPTSAGTESGYTIGSPSGGPTGYGSFANTTKAGYTSGDSTTSATCGARIAPPNEDIAQGAQSGPTYSSRETVIYPDAVQTTTYSVTQLFKSYKYRYNYSSGRCNLQSQVSPTWTQSTPETTTRSVTWTSEQVVQPTAYKYKQVPTNISGLKNGTTWNNSVDLPLNVSSAITDVNGSPFKRVAMTTVSWSGCIEERQTKQNTDGNYTDDWDAYGYPFNDPMPSPLTSVYDLNIDLTPNAARPETLWGPHLPNAVWGRYNGSTTSDYTQGDVDTSNNLSRNVSSSCPTEARKMQIWNSGTTFSTYVDSLSPGGNTYHDIGMLWGWRLMSPTGIFAAENATTPGGAQIQRHLIFMTDGDTVNTMSNYTAYGAQWWDRRETNSTVDSDLESATDSRMDAMCRELKNRANVQVWIVYYGGTTDPNTQTRMQACATDASHFFQVTTTPALVTAFSGIATRISQLRLTN